MEHRAVDDAGREVDRAAAAGVEHHVVGGEAAVASKPTCQSARKSWRLPVGGEIVVAVEPQLAGPAGHVRGERRDGRPLAGLALLAAEAPPIRRVSTSTAASGTPSTRATMCCTSAGSCVEE